MSLNLSSMSRSVYPFIILFRCSPNPMTTKTQLTIICIGNLLHGNDGVGHSVFKRLQTLSLPQQVTLIDGGIGGLTLLPFCKNTERLLFVDMIKTELEPGSVTLMENVLDNLPFTADARGDHGGNLTTLLSMLPVYLDEQPMVDLLVVSAEDAKHFSLNTDQHIKDAIDEACINIQSYIQLHI